MANESLGWTQDQEIECTKCGKTTKFSSVSFTDGYGDVRLNFVKINCCDSYTCPHCGNEMEVDVAWWQREFSYKAENGETLVRVVPLWVEDYSNGCSVEELKWPASFTSNTYDFDDLRLDFVGALELIGHLYECTKDPALLSIKNELDKKADLYEDMSDETYEDLDRREKFETESIEAVIPELKRIIDSHDDVLKDPYMPKN